MTADSSTQPQSVYHYTSKETALEHILPHMTIRFGSLGRTNDPRETKIWGFLSGFRRKKVGLEDLLQDSAFVSRTANAIRYKEWWCFCCSTDDDQYVSVPQYGPKSFTDKSPGYTRTQLWAHYASSHRGVCLELDTEKFREALHLSVGAKGGAVFEGFVDYHRETTESARRVAVRACRIAWRSPKDQMVERVRQHIRRHWKWFFLRKTVDWSTEHEYRWLINASRKPKLVDISGCLRSVILGPDASSADCRAVERLCRPYGVSVDQLHWWNGLPSRAPARSPDVEPRMKGGYVITLKLE